jgi:hypothetical protein
MKTLFGASTLIVIALLTSCSGSKFMNRKYTNGRFIEHKSNIKHNTIFADTTKQYASSLNSIELIIPSNPIGTNTDKEIINAITNNILKKDSIFRIQRRGRDKIVIKKCDTKDILIILNSHRQIIKIKNTGNATSTNAENNESNNYQLKSLVKAKRIMKIASKLIFFPIAGIIMSALALKKINIASDANPNYNFSRVKTLYKWLLFLSIIIAIASIIGGFAYYINFIYVPMTAIY